MVVFRAQQLKAKFKHAADFGVQGGYNPSSASRYDEIRIGAAGARNRPGNAGGFDCHGRAGSVRDVQELCHASACARSAVLKQPVYRQPCVSRGTDVG